MDKSNEQIKMYAPVLITTLNRYVHFKECVESLSKCTWADRTAVYIGLDYPPSKSYFEGWSKIDAYLELLEKKNNFKSLTVFRREKNCGVKGIESNSTLLTNFACENYDRFIFSEDDNIFAPNFLVYMNRCLALYEDNMDVIAVTGYSYPVDWVHDYQATVHKQNFNASAWGWGWWVNKRQAVLKHISSGEMYDKAPEVIKQHKFEKNIFNAYYEYVCASIIPIEYLREIKSGRLSLTDYTVRQFLTIYDKYVVSPLVSKVRTMGYDGSGIYCQKITAGDGRDELHTNFDEQYIDNDIDFKIIENSPLYLTENLRRLNIYQRRPLSRHIVVSLITLGISFFGLRFMRKFTMLVFKVWHRRVN